MKPAPASSSAVITVSRLMTTSLRLMGRSRKRRISFLTVAQASSLPVCNTGAHAGKDACATAVADASSVREGQPTLAQARMPALRRNAGFQPVRAGWKPAIRLLSDNPGQAQNLGADLHARAPGSVHVDGKAHFAVFQ